MQIDGRMPLESLKLLNDLAQGKDLVIEFGVFRGRSAAALSVAKKVICVDNWEAPRYHGPDAEQAFDELAGKLGNVFKRKGDLYSDSFKAMLEKEFKGKADLVFIDAAHDYQSVRSDILLARGLVKPSGIICGHDYHEKQYSGLVQAVREMIGSFVVNGDIWIEQRGIKNDANN